MFALVGRKEMDHHIPVIQHEPAFLWLPFHAALLLIILFCRFEDTFSKRIQHAVAGAVADDKIIGKRCDVLDVEKQDVFALFVLQGGDDCMCKFECVQMSPHDLPRSVARLFLSGCYPFNDAEYNRV